MRPTYIGETREQAERDARHGFNVLGQWGSTGLHRTWQGMVTEDEVEERDFDLDLSQFQIKHGLLLIGTPDSVAEQIERLESELDCGHLALFLNIPLLSYRAGHAQPAPVRRGDHAEVRRRCGAGYPGGRLRVAARVVLLVPCP